MLKLALRRLVISIPLLIVVSFLVFLLIDLAPGDAATNLAGSDPSPENIAAIRDSLGLDDPIIVRYVDWLGNAVTGDLGSSYITTREVGSVIWERTATTASLVLVTMIFTSIAALILGTLAAVRPGGLLDRFVTALSAVAVAVPPFWIALLLILYFALNRTWFPALNYVPLSEGFWPWLEHLVLPAIALGAAVGAELTLQLKASLTEVLGRDFVLTARAKGMSSSSVVLKHGLKNAAVPVVTVLGLRFAQLLGGTVIIERIFNMQGLGSLALESTITRDVPILLGLVVVMTLIVLAMNLLVDMSYGYFNPKVRT